MTVLYIFPDLDSEPPTGKTYNYSGFFFYDNGHFFGFLLRRLLVAWKECSGPIIDVFVTAVFRYAASVPYGWYGEPGKREPRLV